MSMDRLISMGLRMIMRRLITRSVDKGIDMTLGPKGAAQDPSAEDRAQAKQAKQTAKRAKKAARITRRMARF